MATYFIVGGSKSIGFQLVTQLSTEGHTVHATYHRTMKESNAYLHYHPLDVLSDSPDVSFLPESLDGFVYCPGSISLKPFQRLNPSDLVQDYQLNVVGAIKLLQAVLPRLKKSTQASVIFFSTVAVKLGLPFHSQVAASKGAVEGLVKALAAELAPRIRVNCIAPSLTDTALAAALLNTDEKRAAGAQRHPLQRIGLPGDVSELAAFLLSDKAGWITGQVFGVDGGLSTLRL